MNKSIFITCLGALVFSLVSGLGYIVNDWVDKENDQFHPEKQNRPFCAGIVSGKMRQSFIEKIKPDIL